MNKSSRFTRSTLFIPCLFAGFWNQAYAENLYQVSLVLFEQKNSITGNEQRTVKHSDLFNAPANTVIMDDESSSDSSFFGAMPSDQQYLDALASIKVSSNYKIIAQKSWVQPGLNQNSAKPVLISAGESFGDHSQLEGTVTLTVGHYLHMYANLWLGEYEQQVEVQPWWQDEDKEEPNRPPGAAETANSTVARNDAQPYTTTLTQADTTQYLPTQMTHMQETRRLRSGELHYFDNPWFGMLVSVTPYKE